MLIKHLLTQFHMPKNLVIVESPAKAKTIEGYLGKDFTVKSSFGHVRDLPKGNDAIDIAHGYQPRYEISDDKKQIVSELRKLAKDSETVWLATDDDREGEAISWHLLESLGIPESRTKRIVFREITKGAILKAIDNPRMIDRDLVNAQQARRVLDRLVGFEISPILWKKIKGGLSAGRVQSVAVRVLVEREREIEAFNSQGSYRIRGLFEAEKGRTLTAELPKNLAAKADAEAFLLGCQPATYTVEALEVKPAKRSPAPPFTTSTLQQEASLKLGYGVARTMTLAQRLYEAGLISYMRTDSVNLSDTAIQGATHEIKSSYGETFVKVRKFKNKSESAQEAHEAIRPTDFARHTAGDDNDQRKLYELIWKRAIASQMADAELERTTATIGISTMSQRLFANGEVIKFEGFLKVYIESKLDDSGDEEDSKLLPPLAVGQVLGLMNLKATERFSKPAPRYTEASLVKKLEELGIGRPSTYAPTISTIIAREYVAKESRDGKPRPYVELTLDKQRQLSAQVLTEMVGAEKNKLFPTDMGTIVTDFLVAHFHNVIDYSFTAEVEKEFDIIAQGGMIWNEMIDKFYVKFHKDVEDSAQIARADVGAARELGIHPEFGKKVVVRLGRYGAVAQIGLTEDGDTPQYANLKTGQRLETLTMEDALELFKLPRIVGDFEDKTIKAAAGRFGPYLQHDGKFYSLPKGEDPLVVSYDRSLEIIAAKRKADAEKLIKSFAEDEAIQILNGRWGPYLAKDGSNYKIPKTQEAAELTYEQCLTIIAEAPPTPAKGRGAKGKAKAPAARATTKAPAKSKAAPKPKAEAKPKVAPKAKAASTPAGKTKAPAKAKAVADTKGPTLRKTKGE